MKYAAGTHRTTLNLPATLLREAEEIYGTRSPTVAITRALEEALALHHRRRLLEMDWSAVTPEAVEEMRADRTS